MRVFTIIFVLFFSGLALSQSKMVEVKFAPYLLGKPLKIDSLYILGEDSLTISKCRFYVSGLAIVNEINQSDHAREALLIDTDSNRNIAKLLFPASKHPQTLEFNFGTDSLTNVSGAMSGDLDPMHGMYWTWQSGYINLKLEGKSSASSDRKKGFEFHLGGYSAPFNSMQKVSLSIPDKQEIVVVLDLDDFFRETNLQKTHHVMRPCAEAVSLSRLMASNFRFL